MQRILFVFLLHFLPLFMLGQYNWELEKDKDGIQVYSSELKDFPFRVTKVECVLEGNYEQLVEVISDVEGMTDWVFKSSSCTRMETYGELDFLYVVITDMPWPMSNRESVIHLRFEMDSLPHSMRIIGTEATEPLPLTPGLERVSDYYAVWNVTMPEENKLKIEYILKLDPGGGITPWMAGLMVEKGPYETFKGLSEKLKALN